MIQLSETSSTAIELFEYAKKHKLVPGDAVEAVQLFQALAGSGQFYELLKDGERAGLLIVTEPSYLVKAIDIIPESKKFSPAEVDDTADLVHDLAVSFLTDGARRVSAAVPESRRKTIRILRRAYFRREGSMRLAWQSAGRPAEDIQIFGLIHEDIPGSKEE